MCIYIYIYTMVTRNMIPCRKADRYQRLEEKLRVRLCSSSSRRLKRDGTRAETRSRLSAKRTSPFKSAGTSVQSTTGSRGVRISGSNAG